MNYLQQQQQQQEMNNASSSSASSSTSSVSYLIQNESLSPNDTSTSQRLIAKEDSISCSSKKLKKLMNNVSIVSLNETGAVGEELMSPKERELIINHTLNNLDTIQRKLALSELRYPYSTNAVSPNTSRLLNHHHQQQHHNHHHYNHQRSPSYTNTSIGLANEIFNMTKITYKSKYLMPFTLLMLAFTLLPIQYHGENFGLQMKVMIDACLDSYGYFNENQTNLLDTIFPYGFSNSLSFDYLSYELKALDEINRKYSSPNLTIKYLTQTDCINNNFSKILNIITIKTPAFKPMSTTPEIMTTMNPYQLLTNYHFNHINFNKPQPQQQFESTNNQMPFYRNLNQYASSKYDLNPEFKYNYHYQQQQKQQQQQQQQQPKQMMELTPNYINILIICDDEAYRRSLINGNGGSTVIPLVSLNTAPPTTTTTTTLSNDYFNSESIPPVDTFDFQTNILSQWNISCKNLSSSTVTISYAQMTFLSGEIIGSIFFSMLADYIGRKRIYLLTLYVSTVIGALVSMVQSYKQFVIIRFPIAALAQGCYIVSYVLLFEMILKSRSRNTYCSIFVASQFICNIIIACMTKFIRDWRYMQLTGSLISSFSIVYPWLIKESFKWLIVRDDFINAERVCKGIFKENGIIARLMKLKSDDQLNDDFQSTNWWPIVIWQPTFRKIICYFVLMWSILSLTNFFVNEEVVKIVFYNVDNYILQNGLLALANIVVGLIYFKVGKRFPLGSCLFLGGAFYLASSLISQDLNAEWFRILFHMLAKILFSCAINILMLYVCELFPCEIRCSSLSFFLSIKHLSEMFAIYIFKVNVLSMGMIKIGLAIFCLLMCICALLLPERSAFAFNLDYIEYLNRNHQFIINSSTSTARKNTCNPSSSTTTTAPAATTTNEVDQQQLASNQPLNVEENRIDLMKCDEKLTNSLTTTVSSSLTLKATSSSNIGSNINNPQQQQYQHQPQQQQQQQLFFNASAIKTATSRKDPLKISNEDDCEQSILANTLIKKINCENHCKTGKLNPLYEEEQIIATTSSSTFNPLTSRLVSLTPTNTTTTSQTIFNLNTTPIKNASSMHQASNENLVDLIKETSTKF